MIYGFIIAGQSYLPWLLVEVAAVSEPVHVAVVHRVPGHDEDEAGGGMTLKN